MDCSGDYKNLSHEKTAHEVEQAEWNKVFSALNQVFSAICKTEDEKKHVIDLSKICFDQGFAAGRRGERIEQRERLLFALMGPGA